MPEALLRTKLFIPPTRPNLVPRPQLIEQLNQGMQQSHKLTLVSAPAGFGKSTLVSEWLASSERPAAWLSLDQGDNDLVRFWTYLIAAVQTVDSELGIEARQIISAPQLRSSEPAAVSLINDISQHQQDLILVIDDYHVIEEERVHEGLSYLLDHQPPNLHLILIARADPNISLARLRAHGRLVEIRASDLQFSSQEADVLFNEKADLGLKLEQVEALNRRAEGWIVGLNLAALSLKGHPASESMIERFTGSHRFILDYLTEEVLDTVPDAQRQFLLRTSILDRFCLPLCEAVAGSGINPHSGRPNSQQALDELRGSSPFLIPLDADGTWFRYHRLFAEVLSALLERDHPGEVDGLHLQAAAWFESEGFSGEAVDHALRSGDMVLAREFFLEHWLPFLHRGEIATVLHWLNALPDEMKNEDPFVAIAHCWTLFVGGRSSAIGPRLEQADQAYQHMVYEGSLSIEQQDRIASQLAMMRSVLARSQGDHSRSVAYAEEAASLIPPEMMANLGTQWNMLAVARGGAGDFDGAIEAYSRGIVGAYAAGNLIGAYGSIFGQIMYMLVQGHLNEAESLCRTALDRAANEGHGDLPAAGWLHIAMARIKLERCHLDETEAYLNTGLRIARPGGFGEAERFGRYMRGHLAATRGDLAAAADIFQDTEKILNAMNEEFLVGELSREWSALYLTAGDLDTAREKLHILEEKTAITQHAHLLIGLRWLVPRLLCEEKQFEEALAALEESIRHTRAANSRGELIRLLPLRSVALDALGEQQPARTVLREALTLGAPEGYIWRWLDAGPGIEPLLRDLRGERDTPQASHTYLDSLLDASQSAFGGSTQPQTGMLPDPLTPRELEIMRLIGQGYSNPDIAHQLVVSINTIKKHTSNIYSKLGVSSRTQAIARAQQLNLL